MAWTELNKKKWELRHNDQVLATIYNKSLNRYSVYFAVPLIFEKVRDILGKTHSFKSLEEAKEQCDKMLIERVMPWADAAVRYCQQAIPWPSEDELKEAEKLEFGGQDRPSH